MGLRNLPWKEQALARAIAQEVAAVLPGAIQQALDARDADRAAQQPTPADDRLAG